MVFSSISFLFVFLPLLLAVYFLLPARLREGRNLVLLLFSLFFYGYGGPRFLLLMLLSIAVNYAGGLLAAPDRRRRRLWTGLVTAVNLGLLGWFKYAGFLGANLNRIWTGLPVPEVALPIGISFFTFQGLSYVLDVYRGEAAPERNPLRVALYISLFPQLVAGPIVRYTTVADEIRNRRETLDAFTDGAVRFLFGLGKKMLLANQLGLLADQVYATRPEFLTTALAWLGAAWNFLCWGLYFGRLRVVEMYGWGRILERAPAALRHLYAMVLIVVSWVLFRAETLDYAVRFLQAMAGFAQGGLTDGRTTYYLLEFRWELLLAIPAAMPVKSWLQNWLESKSGAAAQALLAWGPKLIALGMFGLSFLRLVSSSFNPFIYFRF